MEQLSYGFEYNEESMGIMLMWALGFIYEITSWSDRNPIFGLVFFWVAGGVIDQNMGKSETGEMSNITWNLLVMMAMHAASMFGLSGMLLFEEV